MPVMFRLEGQELDLDDMPLDVYADIEKETGVPWYRLTANPMAHAAAVVVLVKKCAERLGVEPPATLTPKLLVDMFEVVSEPNLPTEYNEGIPDPKAPEEDPETT